MLLTLLVIVWVLIWVLVLVDIVRRPDLRTSSKVLWAVGVLIIPVIGVIVYVVVRPGDPGQYAPADGDIVHGADSSYEGVQDRHPV
jgi:hypothetical protein